MNFKSFYKEPYWQVVGLFFLIKICLHLFTFDNYELHRDEMLYFNQGDYLSFGNATVPPFISWIAFLIKSVFGYSIFGIRLMPMLFGALSVIIIAKIVIVLEGRLLALIMSCTAYVLSPGFLIFGSLFTVNVFDQFFWLFISYLFIKMIKDSNPKLWIWIGVVSGFAFLNKYLVIILVIAFLVVLLFSSYRKLLFTKYLIYAGVIGLFIVLPNIYWQYAHGWTIFLHIDELEKSQMVNMTSRNFLIDLFNLNYISTFFWLIGLLAVVFIKSESRNRYLFFVAVAILMLVMFMRGKAYYILGLIPVLYALSGYVLGKYITVKYKFINYIILGIIVVFSILSIPFSIPLLSFEKLSDYSKKTASFVSYPFSRWEDGELRPISQVFSDMTGWEELVSIVNQAYLQIPETARKQTTIYAERNYGYAGAVHFYGKKYQLPEAITFLDSYVLWAPDTIAKGPLIYINFEIAGLDNFFEKVTEVGAVNNIYFRENGLKVFLCENPNGKLQEVYRQKASDEKQNYR